MEYSVTGAPGFVGSEVVDQLVARSDEVVALTRDRSNAQHRPEDVTVVEGDNPEATDGLGLEHRSLEERRREYLEWKVAQPGVDAATRATVADG